METVAMQLGGARNVIQCSRASSLGRFFLRADADSSSWLADAVRAASVLSDAIQRLAVCYHKLCTCSWGLKQCEREETRFAHKLIFIASAAHTEIG